MRVAIIGAGFFGTSCAIRLAKKHTVHIFEKKETILCGASRANQLRFHLGYHYPRSQKTILEIKKNYKEFIKFFGQDVFAKTKNYYGISREKSKINYNDYLKFLKKNKLQFRKIDIKDFSKKIEGQIISNEKNLDYFKIKKKILKNLKHKNIQIFLKANFNKKLLNSYDKIIIATYDNNNALLNQLGIKIRNKYKFELVEKIIIKMPVRFKSKSYMVLDGKFVCLDPYVGTKYHLLSDVKNSKLEIVKGKYAKFNHFNKKYLNKGIIKKKNKSQFNNFINHGSKYLPIIKKAKYIGSFFVTRAIKIGKEKTDERLNEINVNGSKIITIFSGKWNTCIGVAKKIESMLK